MSSIYTTLRVFHFVLVSWRDMTSSSEIIIDTGTDGHIGDLIPLAPYRDKKLRPPDRNGEPVTSSHSPVLVWQRFNDIFEFQIAHDIDTSTVPLVLFADKKKSIEMDVFKAKKGKKKKQKKNKKR